MFKYSERFSKEVDEVAWKYNSSIKIDKRMYKEDIQGSIAHSKMLAKCGIISEYEQILIENGLLGILEDIKNKILIIDDNAEDIHMFIEGELTDRIGEAGKKLHTARSRNDQVVNDLRLYLRSKISEIRSLIIEMIDVILKKSGQHLDTIMCGYTHLQAAQPISFAHYLMAYANMLLRDFDRFNDAYKRLNYSPLGSCALAGTTYKIDRKMVSDLLDFTDVIPNSIDAVSDRDFVLDVEYASTLLMVHLSRLAEEMIMFSSLEFSYIVIDDAYTTGSSIMPQKKNPDMCELVRSKASGVIGSMTGFLSTMKGLPLAYNKDLQEDKISVFYCTDTVVDSLKIFTGIISTLKVNVNKMKEVAKGGYINATDMADYLVNKGMSFRDAYRIVGRIVKDLNQIPFEDKELNFYKKYSELFDNDLYEFISLEHCLNYRSVFGGPCKSSVLKQIEQVSDLLEKFKKTGDM